VFVDACSHAGDSPDFVACRDLALTGEARLAPRGEPIQQAKICLRRPQGDAARKASAFSFV